MINECNVIRDILPLYAENMVSADTERFVEEHLKNCGECRRELEKIKMPEKLQTYCKELPLAGIRKKLLVKRIQTIILSVIMVLAVVVVAFAYLSAPVYFDYSEDLVTVTENDDGSITLSFREDVTSYSCQSYAAPSEVRGEYYTVEAWTSLIGMWMSSGNGGGTVTVRAAEDEQLTVYYAPNNGEEDVCIYGAAPVNGGVITLPRLALNYYLGIVMLLFVVLGVLWLIFRKKPRAKIRLERALLFPVSYLVSHFAICGVSAVSYSMTRDFFLILLVSLLVCGVLLLVHNVWRIRKEIKELI